MYHKHSVHYVLMKYCQIGNAGGDAAMSMLEQQGTNKQLFIYKVKPL